MYDIYKNIKEFNSNKKQKILIVYDDVTADLHSKQTLNPTVTELFIRCRKIAVTLFFSTQTHSAVPKTIRLNSAHCFIMKIPNKQELQQIAINHLSDIDFQSFMNRYIKKCTSKPHSFLVTDTTLASNNPLRVRKNLLERI